MKKRIHIDPDVLANAVQYVELQLATMRDHGSVQPLTPDRYDQLVYDCAVYPQELKNMRRKDTP